MHLFYVESGKIVKEEVASFKREAAFSISENSPDTELGNKNTLLSKCLLEMRLGTFSSSHTSSMCCFLKAQISSHCSETLLAPSATRGAKVLLGDNGQSQNWFVLLSQFTLVLAQIQLIALGLLQYTR